MADDIKSIEEHIEWTEYINQRLEVIFRDICDYEKQIDLQMDENDQSSLMKLLERISELHETAKSLSPLKTELRIKSREIEQKVDMLQNAMEMLKIEKSGIAHLQEENEINID